MKNRIKSSCLNCGKAGRGFCSNECKKEYLDRTKLTEVARFCRLCGKRLERGEHEGQYRYLRKNYCSNHHARLAMSQEKSGWWDENDNLGTLSLGEGTEELIEEQARDEIRSLNIY